MLIESTRIRSVLNATKASPAQLSYTSEQSELQEPKSYAFPMNPIPALVILLLGLMMSSHHQESMVATMIHTQWGTLLVGAAFARAATYILFYLSPPTSILPGRPPTELITAFCLMAGGMIFMASVSPLPPLRACEHARLPFYEIQNIDDGTLGTRPHRSHGRQWPGRNVHLYGLDGRDYVLDGVDHCCCCHQRLGCEEGE
jgi:hypothetical protein